MHPNDQELHILGQPGRVWCGVLSPGTLQALAVVLLGQLRLISQLQIWHIVGQIKESWLVVVHCSGHLGSDAGGGNAGWHVSTSWFVNWSVVMRKFVFRVYDFKARVYIDTFYSTQTILEFCEN